VNKGNSLFVPGFDLHKGKFPKSPIDKWMELLYNI